jgi:hypothetical protein
MAGTTESFALYGMQQALVQDVTATQLTSLLSVASCLAKLWGRDINKRSRNKQKDLSACTFTSDLMACLP